MEALNLWREISGYQLCCTMVHGRMARWLGRSQAAREKYVQRSQKVYRSLGQESLQCVQGKGLERTRIGGAQGNSKSIMLLLDAAEELHRTESDEGGADCDVEPSTAATAGVAGRCR